MSDTQTFIEEVQQANAHNAFIEGQRAFRLQQGRNHNPYPAGSPENAEWERGRAMNEETA